MNTTKLWLILAVSALIMLFGFWLKSHSEDQAAPLALDQTGAIIAALGVILVIISIALILRASGII